MGGEPDVLRRGHHHVGDHAAFRQPIRSASTLPGTPPRVSKHSASIASVVSARASAANRANRTHGFRDVAPAHVVNAQLPSPAGWPGWSARALLMAPGIVVMVSSCSLVRAGAVRRGSGSYETSALPSCCALAWPP